MNLQPGSNAWAISGSHTASGKPMLSNDMHLEYSMPGIWYMTHLEAPGLDVSGVALPGVPGVIVGHNQRIAWGITNLQFDVQDLYIEKFDERTGRYLFQGQVEQARQEREIIRVKGRQPVEMTIWVTRHGPSSLQNGRQRMSLRWTAAEPGLLQYPDSRYRPRAELAAVHRRARALSGPGLELRLCRRGWQHRLSRRRQCCPSATDSPAMCRWMARRAISNGMAIIPFDQLPSVFNPPSGIIATSNQNPFPADYPYPVNGNFAPPYRARAGSQPALGAQRLASRRICWPCRRTSTPRSTSFWPGKWWPLTTSATRKIPTSMAPSRCCAPGTARWIRIEAAPLLAQLIFHYVRTAIAENASPGKGAAYDIRCRSP